MHNSSEKKATMDDVARLAGVSRQTVSRVINKKDFFSEETELRVRNAMDQLDYRHDAIARSLASRRTYALGVLTTSFSLYTHALTLEGAEEYARSKGYYLLITRCEASATREPAGAETIRNQPVEGLLILYHGSKSDKHELIYSLPKTLPIVTTGYAPGHPGVDVLNVANFLGAKTAGERLLARGCKRPVMIAGPPMDFDTMDRVAGFCAAYEEAGLAISEDRICYEDWTSEGGFQAMSSFLSRIHDRKISSASSTSDSVIDGVFAHNDLLAVGAMRAIHAAGFSIPGDISLVGFDDIPIAKYIEPALTTLRNPSYELGKACCKKLIDRIEGNQSQGSDGHDTISLIPELIVRETCL